MTEVLDHKLGCRHGKVVRCIGKARVRETGASSSRSITGHVITLTEEVTTLKSQLAAQQVAWEAETVARQAEITAQLSA
ncbi:hypothetical protein C1H46_005945 [Malus baccata]|uniref:Uncharacterized protein n=1 Tax=Malus baccata TaxID=106549 RepID=A0A540ND95_MALBA|nr:hypothetical protein C1H46_005945 [Malus baccata]